MTATITPFNKASLKSRVYQGLSRLIMFGRFAPGEAITYRAMADALGTSVQPVRDAAQRLIADQALERTPGSGVRVPTMSMKNFVEATAIRGELTLLAADLAIERMSDEEINNLKERRARTLLAVQDRDVEQFTQGVFEFYDIICRGARSAYLEPLLHDIWLRLGPTHSLILKKILFKTDSLEAAKALKVETLNAFVARDKPRARKALQAIIAENVRLAAEGTKLW